MNQFLYNLDEIKERITCADVLAFHGVECGSGEILCPFPDHDDGKASFGLYDNGTRFKCHGCDRGGDCIELEQHLSEVEFSEAIETLAQRAGIQPDKPRKIAPGGKEIVATYDYTDPEGKLVGQVLRYKPKGFAQRKPTADGKGWKWEKIPPTLYHLPEVIKAIADNKPVAIVEGEKDADALASVGIVATCNPGGAGKWSDALSEFLRDGKIIILPDRDEPGTKHASKVIRSLGGIASSVKCFHLQRNGKPCKDAFEWVQAGGRKENTKDFEPFDPKSELAKKQDQKETVRRGVHFIANNRGIGTYYLRKPDGCQRRSESGVKQPV